MEERFFLMAFLFRGIFMRFSRQVQIPYKWILFSIGTLLGKLEEVRLPGFLKAKIYLGSFLDPEDIEI